MVWVVPFSVGSGFLVAGLVLVVSAEVGEYVFAFHEGLAYGLCEAGSVVFGYEVQGRICFCVYEHGCSEWVFAHVSPGVLWGVTVSFSHIDCQHVGG